MQDEIKASPEGGAFSCIPPIFVEKGDREPSLVPWYGLAGRFSGYIAVFFTNREPNASPGRLYMRYNKCMRLHEQRSLQVLKLKGVAGWRRLSLYPPRLAAANGIRRPDEHLPYINYKIN